MRPEHDILRDFHTDLSVGDILRRARLRANASLDDIEIAIKVSKAHLIAIEEGRLDDLPGRIYALGFIRSYADHLELDSEKILSLLKRQTGKKLDPTPIIPLERPISDDPTLPTHKTFFVVLAIFIALIAIGPRVVAHMTHSGETVITLNEERHIPPVPNDLKQQMTLLSKPAAPVVVADKPAVDAATAATTAPASEQQPTPPVTAAPAAAQSVVLKAIESVWLEIRDDEGTTIFSRVMAAGEEYWVPDNQTGLVMTLGNAGGLQILVEGTPLPILGKTGKVLRNISLDPASLKEKLKNTSKKSM